MRAETRKITGILIKCSPEEATVIRESLYCLANHLNTQTYGREARTIPRKLAERLMVLDELPEFRDAMLALEE